MEYGIPQTVCVMAKLSEVWKKITARRLCGDEVNGAKVAAGAVAPPK
jgi:hypothetical protein